jgi:hypothetical protein
MKYYDIIGPSTKIGEPRKPIKAKSPIHAARIYAGGDVKKDDIGHICVTDMSNGRWYRYQSLLKDDTTLDDWLKEVKDFNSTT